MGELISKQGIIERQVLGDRLGGRVEFDNSTKEFILYKDGAEFKRLPLREVAITRTNTKTENAFNNR